MYVPSRFTVEEAEAWEIVDRAGAGILVTGSTERLNSVVTPVRPSASRTAMTAHLARANPFWRGIAQGQEILAVFLAASAYVSPAHYPSAAEAPGVVPTWNYVAAEVRGRVHVVEDRDWLLAEVSALTERFESRRDVPWRLDQSDPAYVERLLGAIVGLEIEVTAITGVTKLSQNRPDVDRDRVAAALAEGDLPAREVARWMGER